LCGQDKRGAGKMMKKNIVIFTLAIFVFSLVTVVYPGPGVCAKDAKNTRKVSISPLPPKDATSGNRICPVSGDKITYENQVTYRYQGKKYNFCSFKCLGEFLQSPEKYIAKVNEELEKTKQEGKDKKLKQ
jgi:YHS domain-containing protein